MSGHAELLGLLLPKPYDATEPVLASSLAAEGAALDEAHDIARAVLEAVSPDGAGGLWLADWERVLGLPDQCAGGYAQALAERIAGALAKVRARGGQSRAYYIGVAKALGYDIKIREYRAAVAGRFAAGDTCGEAWVHAWTVRCRSTTIREWGAGSCAGEPLRSWGNALLECVIRRLAPAHTIVTFSYGRVLADWTPLSSAARLSD